MRLSSCLESIFLLLLVFFIIVQKLAILIHAEEVGNNGLAFRLSPIKSELVCKYGEQAGLHVYPHKLRRSCVTHMLNQDADLEVVQKLLDLCQHRHNRPLSATTLASKTCCCG